MAGRNDALNVAELLCARMTHDFSGSVGALSNLLEMAFEQPERAAEPLALASETAAQLVRRLKLLRAAWGPTAEALALDRVHDLALGLAQSRCSVNLDGFPANAVFEPEMARLLLNLLLLAAEGLPRGGDVVATGNPAEFVLAISGPRAIWPGGLAACIANPQAAWAVLEDPRKVQMALTVLLAAAFGIRLSMLMGGGEEPPPLRVSAPRA